MARAKHTPGPWEFTGAGNGMDIYVASAMDHRVVADVVLRHVNNDEVVIANARLIAAAPDLARHLQAVLDDVEKLFHAHDLEPIKRTLTAGRATLSQAGVA